MYNTTRNAVEALTDTVFTSKMLAGKTYFSSLKEHVFMHPQMPFYNKERLSAGTAEKISIMSPRT